MGHPTVGTRHFTRQNPQNEQYQEWTLITVDNNAGVNVGLPTVTSVPFCDRMLTMEESVLSMSVCTEYVGTLSLHSI